MLTTEFEHTSKRCSTLKGTHHTISVSTTRVLSGNRRSCSRSTMTTEFAYHTTKKKAAISTTAKSLFLLLMGGYEDLKITGSVSMQAIGAPSLPFAGVQAGIERITRTTSASKAGCKALLITTSLTFPSAPI